MGHPVFELGSMFNAFVGFSAIDHDAVRNFLGLPYALAENFWRRALAMYLSTEDAELLDEVERKAKIVGYMRLLRRTIRRTEPNREQLIAYYKAQLIRLIPAVDTLTF